MDFAEPPTGAVTVDDIHQLRVDGPRTLLQAVPYLLGFHPRDSLVLVGAGGGLVRVTARLDLNHLARPGPLEHALDVLVRTGADAVIAVAYDDGAAGASPWTEGLSAYVEAAVATAGCVLVDTYLVRGGRWWSSRRDGVVWGAGAGRPVADSPTPFAAAATVAGLTALPGREDLGSVLDPLDRPVRERLLPAIEAARDAVTAAPHQDRCTSERALVRAVFAAARRADAGSPAPADADVARLGAALSVTAVRDSVWLAVDDGRLDGRALWAGLSRRLPPGYDAPALFLYGWACWRRGDGASALIAVERALDSLPAYPAAELLQVALAHGLDPRRLPRLRRSSRRRHRPPTRSTAAVGAAG